ncbi:basic salivary proline-rich protein 1-like [Eschrichtius robustus]|uniref:basic salivary proline-rich protein 1-like n=1 Tax=Eschrichtius robustus TaxID=9764 RepID=UPI0035C060C9
MQPRPGALGPPSGRSVSRPRLPSCPPRRKRPRAPRPPSYPSPPPPPGARASPSRRSPEDLAQPRHQGTPQGIRIWTVRAWQERRLIASSFPPLASRTPKDAGPWRGPEKPQMCHPSPEHTPRVPPGRHCLQAGLRSPFLSAKAARPGTGAEMPRGTPPLLVQGSLSPSVGERGEVWGAGGRDPASVAQPSGCPKESLGTRIRVPPGGRAQGPPLAAARAAAREGRSKQAALGKAAEPTPHKASRAPTHSPVAPLLPYRFLRGSSSPELI